MRRRTLQAFYGVFGLAPAVLLLVPFCRFPFDHLMDVLMLAMPVCGIAGLALACCIPMPARGRAYWIVSGLLMCGIVSLAPVALLAVLSFGRRIEATVLNALLLAWGMAPLLVAFHFIFRAQDIRVTYGTGPLNETR
jgi:hypothetical protein